MKIGLIVLRKLMGEKAYYQRGESKRKPISVILFDFFLVWFILMAVYSIITTIF